MSTLFNGSICLTDIPKDKITVSEKNGKKYLNINLWLNDEPDQFNNNGSIQVSQSKEEREAGAKKQYIGNFKYAKVSNTQTTGNGASENVQAEPIDDLPF